MYANQLIDKLTQLVNQHGNLPLCYGVDEEGNAFKLVAFEAVEGSLDDDQFEEHTPKPTHICIN